MTINYLVFASLDAAIVRSEAAYAPLRQAGTTTTRLWTARPHPVEGSAALEIPPTPAAAGVAMSQEAYEALLDADERATLIATLPEDWEPSEVEM